MSINPLSQVSRLQWLKGVGRRSAHKALSTVLPFFFLQDGGARIGIAILGSPAALEPVDLGDLDLDLHGQVVLDEFLRHVDFHGLAHECASDLGIGELSDEEADLVMSFAMYHVTMWLAEALEESYEDLGS